MRDKSEHAQYTSQVSFIVTSGDEKQRGDLTTAVAFSVRKPLVPSLLIKQQANVRKKAVGVHSDKAYGKLCGLAL